MISSQRPIVTDPLPPAVRVAELITPTGLEGEAASNTMRQAVRNAYAENIILRNTLAAAEAVALSGSNPALKTSQQMNAAVYEAQRQMMIEDTPVPWTSLPADAPSVAAAKRHNTYVSPGQMFMEQPPVVLPCDDRALNGNSTGTPNYAVALNNVLGMGNSYFPQPVPFSVPPPSGTVAVSMNIDPVTAAVGGPIQTVWTTRPPVPVENLAEKTANANGAAQLAVQSWLSFGSPLWPGDSPL